MGGSGSLLSKNGWEWAAFLGKRVGVGRFCRQIGWNELFLLNNGWDWMRVGDSG